MKLQSLYIHIHNFIKLSLFDIKIVNKVSTKHSINFILFTIMRRDGNALKKKKNWKFWRNYFFFPKGKKK